MYERSFDVAQRFASFCYWELASETATTHNFLLTSLHKTHIKKWFIIYGQFDVYDLKDISHINVHVSTDDAPAFD